MYWTRTSPELVTRGIGLPMMILPSPIRISGSDQVEPASVERDTMSDLGDPSEQDSWRPSAKASRVVFTRTMEGIRGHAMVEEGEKTSVGAAPDRAKRTPRRTSAVLGWAKKVIGEVGGVGDWVREGGDWGLRATPSRKSSQKPVDEGVRLQGGKGDAVDAARLRKK